MCAGAPQGLPGRDDGGPVPAAGDDAGRYAHLRAVLKWPVMTPLEKMTSLPDPDAFLKPSITLAQLQAEATRLTDNQAAKQLDEANGQFTSHDIPRSPVVDAGNSHEFKRKMRH
ncbi:MAG: hypothetical protein ACREWG_12065 [Gammaproteobacteria bacterium]